MTERKIIFSLIGFSLINLDGVVKFNLAEFGFGLAYDLLCSSLVWSRRMGQTTGKNKASNWQIVAHL